LESLAVKQNYCTTVKCQTALIIFGTLKKARVGISAQFIIAFKKIAKRPFLRVFFIEKCYSITTHTWVKQRYITLSSNLATELKKLFFLFTRNPCSL